MQRSTSLALAAATLAAGLAITTPASATQRHFNQTYESGVLNPGDVELEPWTTFRHGRTQSYTAYDLRLEYEVGVVPGLQTSLYWNFSTTREADSSGALATTTRLDNISNEWKYQLSDPVADAVGSAVYFEATAGTDNAELEGKVILDKRVGQLLLAANLVGAHEWEWDLGFTERELELGLDTGVGYFITPSFIAGIEARSVSLLADGDQLDSSVIYAGPSIGFVNGTWWTSMSFTPQIAAPKGASAGSRLDLDRQDRLQARVLFGFHL